MGKQLTVAGADYDRTQALIDARIKPDGFELKWLNLSYPEIWTRMLNDYEFDVSELSFASYIIARTSGKPLIAIPVFPLRVFRHSYILIYAGSDIRAPKDLEGKKVGITEFQQTATVWARGILQHEYGVDLTRSIGGHGKQRTGWRSRRRAATLFKPCPRETSRIGC